MTHYSQDYFQTMADDPNKNDPAQPKDPLEQVVESRLTEERLDNIWDRLQGIGNRSAGEDETYGVPELTRDFWITLSVTGMLRKIGWSLGVASLALLAFLFFREGDIILSTPTTWQSASISRLPGSLHFRTGRKSASLLDAALKLTGALGGQSRGAGDITVLDANFSGQQADGTPIRFLGSLLLTNAPGVVNIRRRSDFLGATLVGDLTVGTNAPTKISQPYLP